MDSFGRALNIRLKDHIGRVHRSVQVQQENGQVWIRCTANNKLKPSFTQFTVEVLPVVWRDALVHLKLLLTVCPLSQTLQMNELHRANALARRDERVPTFFLVFKADPTTLSRLLGSLVYNFRVHGLIKRSSQTLIIHYVLNTCPVVFKSKVYGFWKSTALSTEINRLSVPSFKGRRRILNTSLHACHYGHIVRSVHLGSVI